MQPKPKKKIEAERWIKSFDMDWIDSWLIYYLSIMHVLESLLYLTFCHGFALNSSIASISPCSRIFAWCLYQCRAIERNAPIRSPCHVSLWVLIAYRTDISVFRSSVCLFYFASTWILVVVIHTHSNYLFHPSFVYFSYHCHRMKCMRNSFNGKRMLWSLSFSGVCTGCVFCVYS